MKELMTRKEASLLLKCSERTIDRHIKRGTLEAKRIGKLVRIYKDSFAKLIGSEV